VIDANPEIGVHRVEEIMRFIAQINQ
jgi:hypothetical protein